MLSHRLAEPADPARVVVLGAGGFVGRALVTALVRAGITALPLRSTDLDLAADDAGEQLAARLEPQDAVVMLAAITPDKGRGVPAFMSNLKMAAALCAAAERVTLSHLVYFSSAAVYPTGEHPVTEETPAQPPDLFGMMHLAREAMLRSAVHAPLAVLRPTQIHGPVSSLHSYGQNLAYGPNLLRQHARQNGRIVLSGSGAERRDYVLVGDVVEVALRTLRHRSHGLLNVATGQSVALREVAQKIAAQFAPPVPVAVTPRQTAVTHRFFDIAALQAAFPDFAFTPLDRALAEAHGEPAPPEA